MSFIFINMSFYVSHRQISVALTGQECESFYDTILCDGTRSSECNNWHHLLAQDATMG